MSLQNRLAPWVHHNAAADRPYGSRRENGRTVVLLWGGTKRSQTRDIEGFRQSRTRGQCAPRDLVPVLLGRRQSSALHIERRSWAAGHAAQCGTPGETRLSGVKEANVALEGLWNVRQGQKTADYAMRIRPWLLWLPAGLDGFQQTFRFSMKIQLVILNDDASVHNTVADRIESLKGFSH